MTDRNLSGWLPGLLGQISAAVTNTGTGTLNDISTSSSGSVLPAGGVRFTGAAPTATGFVPIVDGQRLPVFAAGGPLVLAHESASSTAANRITTDTGANVTIAQNGAALLVYDGTSSRWKIIGGSGGGGGVSAAGGICTLEQFGAKGDGVTDDSAAWTAARAALAAGTYAALVLGAKTYLVNSTFSMPAGTAIIGQGASSVLKTTANATLIDIPGVEEITLANFRILGNSTGGAQLGITTSGVGCAALHVSDVTIENCGYIGLQLVNSSGLLGPTIRGLRVSGCVTRGVNILQEYVTLEAEITSCGIGLMVAAGNIDADVMITQCTTGIEIFAGGNDAHGVIRGECNHNTTNLSVGATTNGMTFDGVHFYQGTISIVGNTGLMSFVNCVFDADTYDMRGRARMRGCRVLTAYYAAYTEDANSEVDWGDTVHEDGGIPTWIGQRTHLQYTFPSDANQALTKQQSSARIIEVKAGVITAARNLKSTLTPDQGREIELINRAAQTVNFLFASGNGIAIPTLKTAQIGADGTSAICRLITDNVASSVSAFTPTDLAGLLAWYRMDLGATTSGGNITALADQSGTGDANKNLSAVGTIPYTAADASYNNQPTITFGGTQRLQGAGVWAASTAQPVTIYAVGHITTATANGRIYDGNSTNRLALIAESVSNVFAMYAGLSFVDSAVNATNPAKTCVVFNGASSDIYVTDFSTPSGAGNPGTSVINQLVLGALAGGGGEQTGKTAEVIVYSGAHDAATRAQVSAYLAARYGL